MNKTILDVTCGGRSIWFNKHHPAAIYCDKREVDEISENGRRYAVHPDVLADFTELPFPDNSFNLVVFDPPHLRNISQKAWLARKYGVLGDNWQEMIRDGYQECMRVLKPLGVLVFKWSETQIPAEDVWKAIGSKPLFGHHSGKKSATYWACFMKPGEDWSENDAQI